MECWNSGMLVLKGILLFMNFFNYPVNIDFINNPFSRFFKTHYSIIPVFQRFNCDLPARALQWQAGRSELT